MNEWKEYRLGELGEVVTGKTPSSQNTEDWGEEMLFVTPSDYRNYHKYANCSVRKLSTEGINRLGKKILPPKSLLVTCIGSDMGKVAMSCNPCITNQQINSIIPYETTNPNFLYYKLIDLYDTLRVFGGDGTAVPIVNKTDFENITAEMPPLPEQKAIARVLSSLDDKIDLLHRQNATLEKVAETLFRQWFVEEAKEEWEMGCIADSCTHHKASVQPQKNPTKEYYHYSIPAFDNNKNPNIELGGAIQSNKYLVPQYCILFSKLNPHKDKRVWLLQNEVQGNSICSTEFQVVLPKKRTHLYFIYGWLSHSANYNEIASGVGGTSGSHQRIDPSTIFNFQCPIIDDTYIEKYNGTAEPLYQKILMNQTQIRTLTQLRDTLLSKLMSGEVRVIM